MARFKMSFIVIVLVLIGCSPDQTNGNSEKETSVVSAENSADSTINNELTTSTEIQSPSEYLAKNEGEISLQDSQTAYEMCVRVLTDYYKAVWNGSDIELEPFINNENLRRYTRNKIQYKYNLHAQSNDPVQNVEIGTRGVDWEVKYTDDADGGFLYLNLPAEIKKAVGSYGETTEFLVRNVNGKLVIADWYMGGKDTYDFMVRGENETIDNPHIWNESEWVEKLVNKQNQFSGSIH